MNHISRRILSLLLAAVLLLGLFPAALAAPDTAEARPPEEEAPTVPAETAAVPEEEVPTDPEPTEPETEAPEESAPAQTEPSAPADTASLDAPAEETPPTEEIPVGAEDAAPDAPMDTEENPALDIHAGPQSSVTGTVTRSDDINGKYYFWGDAVRDYSFTYADGAAVTAHVGGMCIHYVDGEVAYCIEPNVGSANEVIYDGAAGAESSFWQTKLTAQQRQAIGLVLLYGAPNYTKSADKDTEFGYEGATQVLIWEIVMGLRSSTPPYSRNDRRLYDTFAGGDFPSFDTGYAQIVKLMQAHLTIPSFASAKQEGAPEITLKYDAGSNLYKASVTDTNGVLASDYTFTASGVTMSKSGNTLNISAPLSALANGSVLASATGRSLDAGNMAYMIWTASGKQTVATVEASAELVKAYFKIKADAIPGTATVRKTADSGDVEGYCFKIYRWDSNTSWYGKTDGDGNLYLTDSAYSQSGTKTYTVSNLLDGEYTFLEVLSQKGAGLVFPDSWNITVTDKAGKTVYDKTFTAADFITDDNGDCRLDRVSITGLTGGGNMTMTIHNAPVPADLEILKTSEDGKVSGITFTVEEWAPGIGYCRIGRYTTDESGKILVPKLYVGTKYRLTEAVPEGYIGEAPKEITIQAGTNTVTFENRPIYGSLELTKIDESNPEIKLSGAEFTVTREISSEDPSLGSAIREQVMPEVLDADGHGTGVYRLEHLRYGRYTLRETKAPEGYELSNEVFTIDITEDGKTYTVSSSGFDGVTNRQQVGSIQVKKVDPEGNPLAGVSFLLEYSQDGKGWKSVTFREEGSLPEVGSCTSSGLKDSILTTAEDGIAMFSGLSISIGDNHIYYLLTETTVPEGYTLLPEPAFEGELPQDGSREITVTAVNSSQYMLPFTGNI